MSESPRSQPVEIEIPDGALIVLVGASGSGKTTFARRHFRPTEIVSSDFCRALVGDDESDQSASKDAFELLHFIVAKRLARGSLTVADATSVWPEDRAALVELARAHDAVPVALVLDLPVELCLERNRARTSRSVSAGVVRKQARELKLGLGDLRAEGFRQITVLSSEREVNSVRLERVHDNPSRDLETSGEG
jgi:predicted kinase